MPIQQDKQRALAAFRGCRLSEAAQIYHKCCMTDPADADSWFMLGTLSGQSGNYTQAVEYLEKAVALIPHWFAAWDNLGMAYMFTGDYPAAEESFRKALELNPRHLSALNNLGNLMSQTERTEQAVECFTSILKIDPAFYEARNNLGIVYSKIGRLERAIDCFRRCTELQPLNPTAYHNLGDTFRVKHDLDHALTAYSRALALNPRLADTHVGMAVTCEELNDKTGAASHFASALQLDPHNDKAVLGVARFRTAQGDLDGSLQLLRQQTGLSKHNPELAAEIATTLLLKKDYEGAAACIEPLIDNKPLNARIALVFADISQHTGETKTAIRLLESLPDEAGESTSRNEAVEFALGHLYENLGEFDKAFVHYAGANAMRPWQSDLDQHLAEMDLLQQYFSKEFLASAKHSSICSDRPVFVLGMPRSGTSLVEQILASHPHVFGGGEMTHLWEITRQLPSGRYPESVWELSGTQLDDCTQRYLEKINTLSVTARRITDKLPHNFLHIGFIDMLFPGARIIHCVRDPRDTCFSIYTKKFNLAHLYARDLAALGHYYRHYERLMQHWQNVTSIPMLLVRYEELVNDLAGNARAIIDFCGLDWDKACLDFHRSRRVVLTPSFAQVSKPIYTSSIGRWKYFEKHLSSLLDALESGN